MGRFIYIPKYKLFDLYKREKLSIRKIAILLNCDGKTIYRKLKSFNIKTRTPSEASTKILISRSQLRNLYLSKKLSTNKIGKIYNCDDFTIFKRLRSCGIKIRTKSQAISKYPKYAFSGSLQEKAYIIGFRLGDLHIEKVNHLVVVRCSSTYNEQISLIKNLFKKYGHVHIKKTDRMSGNRNIVNIRCHLNKSFEFLLPKVDNIPIWIRRDKKLFLSFLAGYTDAEGWIGLSRNKHKGQTYFQLATYDKKILNQIKTRLHNLGIIGLVFKLLKSKHKYNLKKDFWCLSLSRQESLLKVLNLLEPFVRHLRKKCDIKKVKLDLVQRQNERNFINSKYSNRKSSGHYIAGH